MKKLVFTGGGTAGHVTPNLAIIKEIRHEDFQIDYIGSKNGIEKELIEKTGIRYHSISSGKLRRYLDFENVKDIFRVLKGCLDARRILKKLKPDLVFSKGGFVSVPVIIAASTLKIPIYIHESDLTPGLANKISQRFATKIFTSFDETKKYLPASKTEAIGSPIRKEILQGSEDKGRRFLEFHSQLPVLLIMGGSLGARKINEAVRNNLDELTKRYQIVHLCGKGNIDALLENRRGYRQFEYVHEELADILATTDFVITRGGSNAIFEFVALEIPMVIIPLSRAQSRGDQILNAESFQAKGYSVTLEEEELTSESLQDHLDMITVKKEEIRRKMREGNQAGALDKLVAEIRAIAAK
ncbi:undecaprenyldiphospho-muramoylpentapeptide beta-N-acetylglucosaminyltransferase [Alkalihalobacillus pseudalcaliphilus]|uniref:undecaprenyldiphospho-muramoylpentapeptide beta-N-acetylglucosaminyltransferase n=1 Tax=Alkalihalobacillus pseudalcaliphilus TaxID=79884 RepID=UPI00064DF7D0|nr:undecaprenyldiphospho-muramoylpentapeptide beta-N-acetylglucosaminyltransferase [Alkalihalobacillus pseudalcaliphilus]KMK75510.1 UDP-diphospho-muramoylpentapeptide beta-N- acetylglucosaminyltransferase [Alkalihalobacillus pseudalcaliphilus]